ncbi:hypothetical protein ManeNPV_00110 [Malacosoma neustria nucleopolyhedrovirus]|uniref:hypothetical protein n=1 Tax=Malacosoma neustria nuclear polyhedrosis virus TaxID=38012 RepID=UPI000E35FE04|nr:hypothetical protein ManeNPV_00110 [Malacosoma neustria nucleopolyhedrovirus]AUF81636.1 hypothetical protein ManeNPV_00110 [Malacosoma neustria nucleopolyhedrovirus]
MNRSVERKEAVYLAQTFEAIGYISRAIECYTMAINFSSDANHNDIEMYKQKILDLRAKKMGESKKQQRNLNSFVLIR